MFPLDDVITSIFFFGLKKKGAPHWGWSHSEWIRSSLLRLDVCKIDGEAH